jgi:hypothetical protein
MTDAETRSVRKQAEHDPSSQPDSNNPLPLTTMAYGHARAAEVPATEARETATGDGNEQEDAVVDLAGALRTAKRAHRAYLAELRQGDVEPSEDWSTWYAEYLLGLR